MSMFLNRIKKNYTHLNKWAKREKCNAFRIYDRDIPEYRYSVDYYNGSFVVYEFATEHTSDFDLDSDGETAEPEFSQLDEIITELSGFFDVDREEIFIKQRKRQKGLSQYEKLELMGARRTVSEFGLKFIVNLSDYLDSGLFLDHRITRQLIGKMAHSKRVLNLFAYTGSASVHAAAGGAAEVVTLDMSNTYLSWAQENMVLNGFTDDRYSYIREDAMKYLKSISARKSEFDLIFVDPPSFSNSKKMEGVFDVQDNHVGLLKDCLDFLPEGGKVVFSTNLRSFKINKDAFKDHILEDISKKTIPADFRNQRIHQAFILTKN